ncbi:MAG: tetratricopeptide repeat protein [Planctomycetes bacterium]|nr:tetratricopeptide repeat protein [Planctomycetota bacterium]
MDERKPCQAIGKLLSAAIQKSIKIQSDNPKSFLALGKVYMADEQFDQAINVINKVVSLNPDMDEAQVQLSKAYIGKGSYDQTRKILQELSMVENRLGLIYFRLAVIFTKQDKYNQAVLEDEATLLHTEELTEKHPEILDVKNLKGSSEEEAKAYQKAINEIKLDLEESLMKDDDRLEINYDE